MSNSIGKSSITELVRDYLKITCTEEKNLSTIILDSVARSCESAISRTTRIRLRMGLKRTQERRCALLWMGLSWLSLWLELSWLSGVGSANRIKPDLVQHWIRCGLE